MVFTHKIVCRKSPKLYASYHNQTPQKTCFNLTEKAAFNLPNNSLPLTDMWYINGRVVSTVLRRKARDFFHISEEMMERMKKQDFIS